MIPPPPCRHTSVDIPITVPPPLTCTNIRLQMPLRNALTLIISNIRRHFLCTDLCKVPGHDPVVQGVEHAEQPQVHPCGRLHVEYEVEPQEGGHHGEVSEDTHEVADLVNE